MGGHWYGDDWYRLEYRPQPDWMFKMANVLRELETFRLEFLGDAKTEVVGERARSMQSLRPHRAVVLSSSSIRHRFHLARKAFREFCTCPRNSQMVSGLWMKNGTCPAAVHLSTSKLLNNLKDLHLHFNVTILAIDLGKTRRETRRMPQGRSRPRQDAVTIAPAHGAPDRGMYVQTCAERPASHLMPLEP